MLRSFDALEALMLVATPLAGNVDPARSSARPTPGVVQFLALLTATDGGRELFDTADRAAAAASEMLRLASDAVRSEALFDFIRDRSQARFASISSTSRREWSESRVGIHALRSVAGRMGYIEQRPLPSPHVLRTASSAAVASYDGQAPEAERLFRDEVGWTAMQGVCIADVMIRMIFRLSIRRDPAQRVPTMQGLFPSRRSTGISASALLSEIPSELGITLAAVEAFLRDMTTSAESVLLCARREKALLADDLVLPHAPNDLWWRPLIADAQRALWYAPAPQLLFGGIERRIADILATDATSPPSEAKQRFRSQRASWAEKEVASLLSAMVGSIGGSPEVALNVEWSHGGLSAPANGEVDVIVALDEIAILVECKSGVWSDAKGKDSKSDLIEKPIEQLASIGLALATGGQSLSLSSPSRIALPVQEELRIRRMLNKPVLVSMYVSLDELGQLGADLSRYRHAHKLPQETSLPYAVSHHENVKRDWPHFARLIWPHWFGS